MTKRAITRQVGTNYQPVNLICTSNGVIELSMRMEMNSYTMSMTLAKFSITRITPILNVLAMTMMSKVIPLPNLQQCFSTNMIFLVIAPAGYNTGGTWLERQIAESCTARCSMSTPLYDGLPSL